MLYQPEKTILNPDSLREGFTQSELTVLDACAEKWYRSYNQMLRLKGYFEWWSVYGTAMHNTLQSFYDRRDGSYRLATLQIPEDVILDNDGERDKQYYTQLLEIQMRRYAHYYREDFQAFEVMENERILTYEHEGVKFSGKIDLKIREGDNVGPMDHKTSSMFTPEIFAGWNFRFQFLFYAWLDWKVSGELPNSIWWNGIRKPQLRQNKNESFESFMVRIEQAMVQEPEKYFKRQHLPIENPESYFKHFEKRILGPKLAKLRLLTDPKTSAIILESLTRNMVSAQCVRFNKTCEFIKLCEFGWQQEGAFYTKRETKHEELEAE